MEDVRLLWPRLLFLLVIEIDDRYRWMSRKNCLEKEVLKKEAYVLGKMLESSESLH